MQCTLFDTVLGCTLAARAGLISSLHRAANPAKVAPCNLTMCPAMQRTLFDRVLGCIRAHDVNTLNVAAEVLEALLGKSSAPGWSSATANHVAVHHLQRFTCNLHIMSQCTIYCALHATCPSCCSAPSTVLHTQPPCHVAAHHLPRFRCNLPIMSQCTIYSALHATCDASCEWIVTCRGVAAVKPRQPIVTVSQCSALLQP